MRACSIIGASGGGGTIGHSIFISYRRKDTGGFAAYVFEKLEPRFGAGQVFFDKESIQGGEVFSERIEESVRACKVLVALISHDWLNAADDVGNRRLENARDLVRREIALALELGKKVIPVVFEVEDKSLPTVQTLPADLHRMLEADFFQVRGKLFEYRAQLGRLIELLADVPGVPAPQPERERAAPIAGPPEKLPYLCDRSEQQAAVHEALETHLRSRAQRPLLLLIHGRVDESHRAFVERMEKHDLPDIAGASLAGPVRFKPLWEGLDFSLSAEAFSSRLRRLIAKEMQIRGEIAGDEALREHLRPDNFGGIAPVVLVESSELGSAAEGALRRLFEYWSAFPDAPPRRLVAFVLCVQYQSAQGGFLAHWRNRRADEAVRRAVAQSGQAYRGADRMTWKVLPELQSVKYADVKRWVSAAKGHLPDKAVRETYGEREPIPMDEAILKMEELLKAYAN
jgi:hypothetical protein